MTTAPSRRRFLTGAGVIAVGFALGGTAEAAPRPRVDGLLRVSDTPATTASWLVLDDRRITVYCGKVELGTGIRTSLAQIVAEELRLTVADIDWVEGDTLVSTEQTGTFGSKSIQNGGPQLRVAAATAFAELQRRAVTALGVPADQLVARFGRFSVRSNPRRSVGYFALAEASQSVLPGDTTAPLVAPADYQLVGRSAPRVDLPGKLDGSFTYVSDVFLPRMKYGRVIRPPGRNVHLADGAVITGVPAGVQLVRRGDFLGVVAGTEWAAVRAVAAISVPWSASTAPLVPQADVPAWLKNPGNVYGSNTERADAVTLDPTTSRTYTTPFHLHGPMAAVSAVADVRAAPDASGVQATVHCSSQSVWVLRRALAPLLGLPEAAIRIRYTEASGCYGHDGSDDVAADAALLSQAAGVPVKVQWSRQDDFGWEPASPASVHDLTGAVHNGRITAWEHLQYTPSANSRPVANVPGSVVAGKLAGLAPDLAPPAATVNQSSRNLPVNYRFPQHAVLNLVASFTTQPAPNNRAAQLPVTFTLPRTSSLRSLGGFGNTFANESFFDELAEQAGADPLDLRIASLATQPGDTAVQADDAARAQAVCQALLPDWQRWHAGTHPAGQGAGVAFQRYETTGAFVAIMVEVAVTAGQIRVNRVVVAHDCGLIVNPDGLRNQIQGNVIQGISRTLYEEATYVGDRMTSTVWQESTFRPDKAYRVIKFDEVPSDVRIILLDHPDKPAYGAGEPALGPMAPAIANAVHAATGVRLRSLPLRL